MDYLFDILKKVVTRRVANGEGLDVVLAEFPKLTAEQVNEIKGGVING